MRLSSGLVTCRAGTYCFRVEIGGYQFEYVGDIEPIRGLDGAIAQFMPQSRYKKASEVALNRYGNGPFCRFKIPNKLRRSGVYAVLVDGEVLYVGECADLSARFNTGYGNISPKNCFKGGQETNCRLNNLIYAAALAGRRLSLWFHQTVDYKAVEVALRCTMKLAWNRV